MLVRQGSIAYALLVLVSQQEAFVAAIKAFHDDVSDSVETDVTAPVGTPKVDEDNEAATSKPWQHHRGHAADSTRRRRGLFRRMTYGIKKLPMIAELSVNKVLTAVHQGYETHEQEKEAKEEREAAARALATGKKVVDASSDGEEDDEDEDAVYTHHAHHQHHRKGFSFTSLKDMGKNVSTNFVALKELLIAKAHDEKLQENVKKRLDNMTHNVIGFMKDLRYVAELRRSNVTDKLATLSSQLQEPMNATSATPL